MLTGWKRGVVVGFCILIAAGCSGGGNAGVAGGGGSTGIGPAGGLVTSDDGTASVNIPPGALSQETTIIALTVSNPASGNIGPAYDFGPNGTTFNQPVTISFTYDDTALPSGTNETDLKLGNLVNNQWQEVAGSTVNTASNIVSGTTTTFSVYGVIAVSSNGGLPAAPSGISAAPGDSKVTISWNAVTEATSYNLYMASASGVTKSNYNTLPDGMKHTQVTSPFTHIGLTNGKTYYFVVTGINANGESPESDEVAATPHDNETLSPGAFTPIASLSTHQAFPGRLGRMAVGRSNHTATVLLDNTVLITGGTDSDMGDLSSAEFYDPVAGTFGQTGSMAIVRANHTATLLPSGKVFIAGGNNLPVTEIFDPAAGAFNPVGSMNSARFSHTATLLPNGKILIAGGTGSLVSNALSSAEIYDPLTGTFSPTGNMTTVRSSHTAT
ncbi:MAG: hypothetical protein L0Y56_12965, partial [Nitrospira sp.]|nr:hypothetical protein [Nitrospira sp.]